MSFRLFIPGPIDVSSDTYAAMSAPMIGHRSGEFVSLYQEIQPELQNLMGTRDPVFLSTSSAWGVMEASVRNLCTKRVLNCMSGAFSDKWHDVSLRCGLEADALQFEWGQEIDPEAIRNALSTGKYDLITLIHNETSTGTLNPLAQIAEVLKEFPEVFSVVDTVSSFSVLPFHKDQWGIDVVLTGSQKALALPPGLSLVSVSERALERARKQANRGYYFDFIEFLNNHEKGMTPSTPAISLIYGLRHQLQKFAQEGLENRFERHRNLNQLVRTWVTDKGLQLLPKPEFGSLSLNCVRNDKEWDLPRIQKTIKQQHGYHIDIGYGKLKGKTFRISNMGDLTHEGLQEFLTRFDSVLSSL